MLKRDMIETSTTHQEWFRITAAARWAGVSTRTVRRWLDKGLTSYRPAGFLLISRCDLDKFIRSYREPTRTCIVSRLSKGAAAVS